MIRIGILTVTILILCVSCVNRKRYTCSCKTTLSDGNGQPVMYETKKKPISEKMRKDQAETVCEHERANINKTYTNIATNNGTRNANFLASTTCKVE